MGTKIGVVATGDRRAVESIAKRRGKSVSAILREERRRERKLFGGGALYRADIMGSGRTK